MSQILDDKINKLPKKEKGLWALRHTSEHVLHAAMQNLYPKLKKAMGPATEEGFYFDFDLDQKISEEDFLKIEKEMQKLIDKDLPMVQELITPEKAKEIFNGNPYKLDWVNEIQKRGEEVSIFKMGEEDLDLCSGPHAKSTGAIKAFKLLSVAGAYWHGDEKNKMLQRIYGTSFPSKKELDYNLKQQEEARQNDHRKLGNELDLFVFSDLVGSGLPLFTEKGATIRRELERFIQDEEIKRGYKHVITPVLAKTDLYRKSGHYPYYKDTMYPVMKVDDDELILRPMACPHHFMLYKSRSRSYKELPMGYAELAGYFRYEKSGELFGLSRVRMFCLADAHIFTPKAKAAKVINDVLDLIEYVSKTFGLEKGKDFRYRLSLGNRKDNKKYFKDDKSWDFAENILREVLVSRKANYFEAENEAAFYGPKIDVQMKKISGQEETAFTVQYDFVMPKRFDLEFVNEEGKNEQPIVVHRSSVGAIERVMAFLIENYRGNFPVWLSPTQVIILPITERNIEYGNKAMKLLSDQSIRVELDDRNETLGNKIRQAQMEKVPYMIVIGDKEEQAKKIAVRLRNGKDLGQIELDKFMEIVKDRIIKKSLDI